MPDQGLDSLLAKKKLLDLANVVLLSSKAWESSQEHLQLKIGERVRKELSESIDGSLLDELCAKSLRFQDRIIKQHNDKQFYVQIEKCVRKKDVHLFHKFADPNLDFMELLIMGDALKRAKPNSITLYAPYITGQRQDKKDDGRVAITSRLVFDLIECSFGQKLEGIVTFDLHAKQAQGYYYGIDELSAIPEFAAYYKTEFAEDLKKGNVLVISPDPGGAKRSRYLAKLLDVSYKVIDKARIGHGKAEQNYDLFLLLKGKKVILCDDIIDSGSSLAGEFENNLIGPVQFFQELGAEVYICATHPIFSEKNGISAEERFRKAQVPVLLTDSIYKGENYYLSNKDWMEVISLDYVLAKAFYCNQVGDSMDEFLKNREKKMRGDQLNFLLEKQGNGLVDVQERGDIL